MGSNHQTLTFQSKATKQLQNKCLPTYKSATMQSKIPPPLPAFCQSFFCQNSLNQASPKFNNAKVSGFTVTNLGIQWKRLVHLQQSYRLETNQLRSTALFWHRSSSSVQFCVRKITSLYFGCNPMFSVLWGSKYKYENESKWTKKDAAIPGLYSHWYSKCF